MSIIIPDLGMSDMLVIFNGIKTHRQEINKTYRKIIQDG